MEQTLTGLDQELDNSRAYTNFTSVFPKNGKTGSVTGYPEGCGQVFRGTLSSKLAKFLTNAKF